MLCAYYARHSLFFTENEMKYFILTNNSLAVEEFGKTHDVRMVDGKLIDVLIAARDLISQGAVLLTHQL